ncbi:MAG: hypothetical protein NC078_02515 [Ruminococcus sp.]|nr:hypothetical protein [Ruminococcus sp.]
MTESMRSQLKKAADNRDMVELHKFGNDNFCVGYVIAVGDKFCVYASVDSHGNNDGIRLMPVDDICRIAVNSYYICKMLKIRELLGREGSIDSYIEFFRDRECTAEVFFEYAHKKVKFVSVVPRDMDVFELQGIVCSCNNEMLAIRTVADHCIPDGVSYIDIENVIFASCDSEDEKVLLALMTELGEIMRQE